MFCLFPILILSITVGVISFSTLEMNITFPRFPPPFPIVKGKKGMCAITFDGDYLSNLLDKILKILKEKNVKCTFFLTGRFMMLHPEDVRKIVKEGHEVGNHTTRHPHLTTFKENRLQNTLPSVTPGFLYDELYNTERIFYNITGKTISHIWRAPYGEENRKIVNWTRRIGYWEIRWTYDTVDWLSDTLSPKYMNSKKMLKFLLSKDLSGAIILMHVGTTRKGDFPTDILGELIDSLKGRNIKPVTVSELIGIY